MTNLNLIHPLPKLIAIVGPTATGKSDLAVALAEYIQKFSKGSLYAEIVSADSRQIYVGMDIGTGKITTKEMHGIPHHLLNIKSPNTKYFSVDAYKKVADQSIKAIIDRGNIPIMVGGTGFWIDAVTKNLQFPNVKANLAYRQTIKHLSVNELFSQLLQIDPKRAQTIDQLNKVRLIRALEIATFREKQKSVPTLKKATQGYNVLFIGLDLPDPQIDTNIQKRLDKRFSEGMIDEVKNLHSIMKVPWAKLEYFGLEYRFIAEFLQQKITKEQLHTQLFFAIRHYMKRQRTWFRRNKSIHWLDASQDPLRKTIMLVKPFLKLKD